MVGWLGASITGQANSNVLGRFTIVVAVSLFSIGSVAYLFLVRKTTRKDQKRQNRHDASIKAEVLLQLSRGNAELDTETYTEATLQTPALKNLLVTLDSLEDTLNDLIMVSSEDCDRIESIREIISSLMLNLEARNRSHVKIVKQERNYSTKSNEQKPPFAYNEIDITDRGAEDTASCCSDDSFVSAADSIPDKEQLDKLTLYDQEVQALLLQYGQFDFYKEGIETYTTVGVKVRKIRTELLACENDADFTVKVHCIRRAFEVIFERGEWKDWILHTGRSILIRFFTLAGKDSLAFEQEFDGMVLYCQDQKNWPQIEEELKGRGVCSMSFYDILLDFMIMDSFDDLEDPPYALTSVIQNSWLSNSIKEKALTAAVWSLLTAKSRMLKHPDGFMSRFYQMSQHLTPVLVWGFLGPDESLKDACTSFKAMLLGFLRDIFSLGRCKYDSVKTLSEGIIANGKSRAMSKNFVQRDNLNGFDNF